MAADPSSTSPSVPAPEPQKVSFSTEDAPITAVTVFCKNRAEITRVVAFSSPSCLGLHEVELAGLPDRSRFDESSARVKGTGHCTILHVSFSDKLKEDTEPAPTEEEKEAAKAEKKKIEQEIQRLSDEQTVLTQEHARNKRMRELADSFAERVVVATPGGSYKTLSASATVDGPAPSVDDVGKALDWWAAKAVQTDAELHRLDLEERRLKTAVAKLEEQLKCAGSIRRCRTYGANASRKGRVLVSIDVQELGPIELEVRYMIKGATWSPAYDLRVDTQTDSISCTYFGRVTQSTTEDWEGVSLRLSTGEPTVHGTPPALRAKTISLKTAPLPPPALQQMKLGRSRSRRGSNFSREGGEEHSFEEDMDECGGGGYGGPLVGGPGGARQASAICASASAPPPPPGVIPAVAQVVGGGGGIGAVSFVIETPAFIKSNGQTKKLTVGVLQLSAEVTHYVVPAKESAAYLQAKATNNTDYLLLASKDVSIFFDNSFITKTSLTSVSPGESFQTFLGIDPAVKITVAPLRKTSRKRGIFSKSNHVTHTHSTSISNKKRVPVTCVVVDAMPRSTNEIIKVTLKQPLPASVSESEAISDDVLVSGALEMFGGGGGAGGEGGNNDGKSDSSSTNVTQPLPAVNPVVTSVLGVTKSPSNHLAWVGKIAPQGELSIPMEYVVEWPTGKEIEVFE